MPINKNVPIFDSNILITYFLGAQEASIVHTSLKQYGCYINRGIVYETLNYLHNRQSVYFSLKVAKIIYSRPQIFMMLDITHEIETHACTIMEKYLDNGLSFVDCVILAQAQSYKLGVYTADTRMQLYSKVSVTNPFL